MMIDPYVLLTPLLLLPVVWLLRFIGCSSFDSASDTTATPPVVITAPAAGSAYYGESITASATATSGSGKNIKSIQFKIDGIDHGPPQTAMTPVSPFSASISIDTSKLAAGKRSLSATSTDSDGKTADSAAIDIYIPKPLITSFTAGTLRNNYTGWIGINFTVGPKPLRVYALGRLHLSGNVQTHAVKIVVGASQADQADAIVSVPAVGVADNQFAYTTLATPVTLAAGAFYFLLSYEESGKDSFLDKDTTVVADTAVTVTGPEYDQPFGTDAGLPNHSYGLVNLKYTVD
jgi:hypothetical protein